MNQNTYGVAVIHDGCFRLWVDKPGAWGTVEQCAQFIANHLLPKRYEYAELAVYPTFNGRCPSYRLPHATVQRRTRLTLQDLKG